MDGVALFMCVCVCVRVCTACTRWRCCTLLVMGSGDSGSTTSLWQPAANTLTFTEGVTRIPL